MADKTKEAAAAVVTEEDLLKSIKALEAKEPEAEAAPAPESKVEETKLEKSASEAVQECASDKLKKALDVSDTLSEVVALIGAHVDNSLEALAKSLQGSAERDLAFVKVVSDLRKSVDGMSEQIKAFGDQPAAPASAATPAAATEILEKGAGGGKKKEADSGLLRKQISDGLEQLAKKAGEPGSQESMRYINAAIKFESTGEIDDLSLREVQKLYKAA